MKILQIRFKNLNSLVGEWNIDMTNPAYTSSGIFAITGPTGSGKSTILDAICLALYGRTPRLDRVNNSENEIMSRQTGECFAEVVFETSSGRYLCHWSQRRARRRRDGALQSHRRQISIADSEDILDASIGGVTEKVEELTGMKFEHFTRSVLLAQGDFAAFLQASPSERSPILEQITGTEIYSEISIRVHERRRMERDRLELLNAQSAGIIILEPEQEKECRINLINNETKKTQIAEKLNESNNALTWLNTIKALEKDIASLAKEDGRLKDEINAFKPERNRLDQATKVAALDGQYATLTEKRKQQNDDKVALKNGEEVLPGLISRATQLSDLVNLAEKQTRKAKTDLETARPIIHQVVLLDKEIATMRKAIGEAKKSLEDDKKAIEKNRESKLDFENQCTNSNKLLERVNKYFDEHRQDEWLVGNLTGAKEQLKNLAARRQGLLQAKNNVAQAEKACREKREALIKKQKQSSQLEKALNARAKEIQWEEEALSSLLGERLLREYRSEKDSLLRERAYLKQIANLESYRVKLEDGVACPLCGAKEHPFAEGNIPVPDEVEQRIAKLASLITNAEEREDKIRKLREGEVECRNNYNNSKYREEAAGNDIENAESILTLRNGDLNKLNGEYAGLIDSVTQNLKPLGIDDLSDTNLDEIVSSLDSRLKKWQKQIKEREEITNAINRYEKEINRLTGIIDTQEVEITRRKQALESQEKDLSVKKKERLELYGKRSPEEEKASLNAAVNKAEKDEKKARELHLKHQQKVITVQANVDDLKRRIEGRSPELSNLESNFIKSIHSFGLLDEKQYLETVLPIEQRSALTRKANELDSKQTRLQTRQTDLNRRYEQELAKEVTDKSIEEVESLKIELETSLKEIEETIISLKLKLKRNDELKEEYLSLQKGIEAQRKECNRWNKLHDLIGSADGKKYRNFVQGLTFDILIYFANKQLRQLTDRYYLIRDKDSQLELNVVDHYQAEEIRATKNLSGGESFLVSLSLALGLSQMVSRNIRIDSLFLDEGFGTLDEESLSAALDALARYRQDGKIIGIISHVQTVKERISTQIQVIPHSGGRSSLSGAGCSSQ